MIKVNCGHIETSGPKFLIAAELAILFNSINKDSTFTKEEMYKIVDDGFMTDEELNARFAEICEESGKSEEDAMAEALSVSLLSSIRFT